MQCIKIIKNLYLGDMYSMPKDTDIEISVASELFYQNQNHIISENFYYFWKNKTLYINFRNFPDSKDDINSLMIKKCIKTIHKNIKNKKIYIHCVWGVNRSPSLVFIYLVITKVISNTNYKLALKQFKLIYKIFFISFGWNSYIKWNFPYNDIKKILKNY